MLLSTRIPLRRAACQLRFLPRCPSVCRSISQSPKSLSNTEPILPTPISEFVPPVATASKLQVTSNWYTLDDQKLTKSTIWDLFNNVIPAIRETGFLSSEECRKVADVIQSHRVGCYDPKMVFPVVGSIGITQFDNRHDKKAYFDGIAEANTLQARIKKEIGIDIVSRVAAALQQTTGLPTRIAQEGDQQYFCGLLRVVDNYIQIHPDYGHYDGPDWEIGRITSQLTWNILLRQVPGGDTIIYDRAWQGAADDAAFQKEFPRYAYRPTGVQGRLFKALPAVEGDLTFFNPRNFHEVKPCDRAWDRPQELVRYTLSSFVGLLPGEGGKPPTLILWS